MNIIVPHISENPHHPPSKAKTARWLAAGLLAFVSLPTVAVAGGHATLAMGPDHTKMHIEWRNASMVRLDMPAVGGPSIYTLLLGGKLYVVNNGRVMPERAISGMFISRSGTAGHPTLVGPIGRETIAGIRGRVYRLNWPVTSKYGNQNPDRPRDIVLTNNNLVRQMTKAWIANAAEMRNSQMRDSKAMEELFRNRGTLRVGKFFRVVRIDGRMPSASDFALPTAKFQGMASNGLGQGLGQGLDQGLDQGQRQKSGIFSMIKGEIKSMEQQSGNSAPGSRAANTMINKYINRLFRK